MMFNFLKLNMLSWNFKFDANFGWLGIGQIQADKSGFDEIWGLGWLEPPYLGL